MVIGNLGLDFILKSFYKVGYEGDEAGYRGEVNCEFYDALNELYVVFDGGEAIF